MGDEFNKLLLIGRSSAELKNFKSKMPVLYVHGDFLTAMNFLKVKLASMEPFVKKGLYQSKMKLIRIAQLTHSLWWRIHKPSTQERPKPLSFLPSH